MTGNLIIDTETCRMTDVDETISGLLLIRNSRTVCVFEFNKSLLVTANICMIGPYALHIMVKKSSFILHSNLNVKLCRLPERTTNGTILGGYHNMFDGDNTKGNIKDI